MKLPEKPRLILEAIAKGQSYDQILAANPTCTYTDIVAAASDALALLASATEGTAYEERMQAIHEKTSPRLRTLGT